MDIQSLDIQSLLADAVGPAYGMANFVLHPLIQEDERQLYRIDRTGAAPWLLRTYAYPQSAKRQEQHASVLKLLETQGYPAPRLIPTKNGEYVAEHTVGETAWHFVVTTFIEGNVIEGDAPTALRKMGEVLGHFHRFSQSLPVIETQNLSPALWRPETMIPLVQLQLADIQQIVPATNQSSYEQIQRAVDAIPSFHHLPSALNHGDCVPTNAVSMADETIVLIDWADAGLGVLLLDLSWLLLMGMGSIPDGSATSIKAAANTAQLHAIIDGYCRHRVLTPAECEMLLEAIRFVPAAYSGLEFCATCRGESPSALWQGWWARYQAALQAATLVAQRIAQY